MTALLLFAQLLFWEQGPETAAALREAGIARIAAPADRAAAWQQAGFTVVPVPAADLQARELLDPPGVDREIAVASPTQRPWIVASGWRFRRQPTGRWRYEVPAGAALLAAAEAHVFGVDALLKLLNQLNHDGRELPALGNLLRLLGSVPPLPWPDVAQIALADDGSELVGEVMNLFSRRNLLWRPLAEKPAAPALLTIRIGSAAYPKKAAQDPSEFAQRIRTRIGDRRRALRVYGSEAVLSRLQVGEGGGRARLQLINYGGNVEEGVRIRLLGAYPRGTALTDRAARQPTLDHLVAGGVTELTVPPFAIYATVDLER